MTAAWMGRVQRLETLSETLDARRTLGPATGLRVEAGRRSEATRGKTPDL
jgi:hypothetical protein